MGFSENCLIHAKENDGVLGPVTPRVRFVIKKERTFVNIDGVPVCFYLDYRLDLQFS